MNQTLFDAPKDEPKETRALRIKSVTISNVKGMESWSGDLGPDLTIFSGENGVGKSSLLEATKNVLMGAASLATIGRYDEEPSVTVVLHGDGEKRIAKTGAKTPVIKAQVGKSAAYETVSKPGEYLRSVYEASADPGKFLLASPKDQMEMFLAALPVEWNQARADEIVGEFAPIVAAARIPMEHLYPLQKVDAIHGAIFGARTGVNRDEKAKRSAADQTLRDAPAEIPQGVDERIAEKRAEIATLQSSVSKQTEAWRGAYRSAEEKAQAAYAASVAAAKATMDAALAEAKAQAESDKAEIASADGALQRENLELSALLRDQTDAAKIAAMHETAAKFTADALSLEGTAERMGATLAQLDAFRAEMVQDIPINGVTIRDGWIWVNKVRLDQVNTADRAAMAFCVATLRLKGLPLRVIFLDNLEALDAAHRKMLFAIAKKEGFQVIGAMRTEGPLTVERS